MTHKHSLIVTGILLSSLAAAAAAQQTPTALQFRPVVQPGTTIAGHKLTPDTAINSVMPGNEGKEGENHVS